MILKCKLIKVNINRLNEPCWHVSQNGAHVLIHTADKIRVLKARLGFFLNLSKKLRADPKSESNSLKCNQSRFNSSLGKENMSSRNIAMVVVFDNRYRMRKERGTTDYLRDPPPHTLSWWQREWLSVQAAKSDGLGPSLRSTRPQDLEKLLLLVDAFRLPAPWPGLPHCTPSPPHPATLPRPQPTPPTPAAQCSRSPWAGAPLRLCPCRSVCLECASLRCPQGILPRFSMSLLRCPLTNQWKYAAFPGSTRLRSGSNISRPLVTKTNDQK